MWEGSPPRVRGKLIGASDCPYFRRITPACAGKTTIITTAGKDLKDHPRVCGENL